jgi:chaperonin GroES
MKVRPLGDKIIVKRHEAESQTDSGIYLPESAKDKPKQGKIIALGDGNLNKNAFPSPSRRATKSSSARTPVPR